MADITSMGIDEDDILRFVVADFAPRLPEYKERMQAYCVSLDRMHPHPDIMLLQGVRP